MHSDAIFTAHSFINLADFLPAPTPSTLDAKDFAVPSFEFYIWSSSQHMKILKNEWEEVW